jgi:hypothetical protein
LSYIFTDNAIFQKETYGGKTLDGDLEEAMALPLLPFKTEGLAVATLWASELKTHVSWTKQGTINGHTLGYQRSAVEQTLKP